MGQTPWFPSADIGLRRTRRLTDLFAWLMALGIVPELVATAGPGAVRLVVGGLIAVCLVSWVLSAEGDAAWISALEGVLLALGCVAVSRPDPMIGLLYGMTVRKAVRDRPHPYLLRVSLPLCGYLAGVVVTAVHRSQPGTSATMVSVLVPSLVPLIGLVVSMVALRDTVVAATTAEAARRDAMQANARIDAILQASPLGLVVLDQTGAIQMSNEEAHRLLGCIDARDGEGLRSCGHPDATGVCAHDCVHVLLTQVTATAGGSTEMSYRRTDGTAGALEAHVAQVPDAAGAPATVLALSDISTHKTREDRLRDRAEHDSLTGVAGRGHFTDLVEHELSSPPHGRPVALLLIDLDDFKEVNDAHGHDVGDKFLVAAARRIERAVDGVGVAGRLGGDEFAVLAPGRNERQARQLGDRILAELGTPALVDGRCVAIRASVGVAIRDGHEQQSMATLLRDADTAMYEAKRGGGHRVQPFRRSMRVRLLRRQRDESDLRVAIENNQLVLHYQPIVDLRTGRISGAEALIRWQHPGLGLRPPNTFIGLAESTDLIIPLGEWALNAACEQAQRWSACGVPLVMSVNVSSHQLSADGFLDALDRILSHTGLPASRLTLELTESALAHDAALVTLQGVRELGVQVALDDFGTGYSSLSYLQRHPFDLVKIDRSFVAQLGQSPRAAGIIRCIIELAAVLSTPVVGEGVETDAQADFLGQAGCALAQGYHFGRPTPADAWSRFVPQLEPLDNSDSLIN